MPGPIFTRRGMIEAAAGATAAALAAKAVAQDHSGHPFNMGIVPGGRNDPKLAAGKISVAFMLDEAATMMDFAGPWEVFQDVEMGGGSGCYLYTVAPKMQQYDTTGTLAMTDAGHEVKGLAFVPDYSFDNAPQPQIVVMGAQLYLDGPEKIAWLQKVAPKAEVVLSNCTGNFIAANAGLLDGLKATTHHRWFNLFEKSFPRVQLMRDQRVVDNGKFVSGGGITAGIDAALHVIHRYFDDKVVQGTIDYMEYRAQA